MGRGLFIEPRACYGAGFLRHVSRGGLCDRLICRSHLLMAMAPNGTTHRGLETGSTEEELPPGTISQLGWPRRLLHGETEAVPAGGRHPIPEMIS